MENIGRNSINQREGDDAQNIPFGRLPPREFLRVDDIDTGWHAEMQRRRLQRLLSTSIFICFLVLFFDNNHGIPRRHSLRTAAPNKISENNATLVREKKIEELSKILKEERSPIFENPLNVSGIFSGKWGQLNKNTYEKIRKEEPKSQITPVLDGMQVGKNHRAAIHDVTRGSLWLFLQMKASAEEKLKDEVAYITGQAILHDEDSTFAATIFSVQGSLIRKNGRMTLFGNNPDAVVQLVYPRHRTIILQNNTVNDTQRFPRDPLDSASSKADEFRLIDGKENELEPVQLDEEEATDSFVISPSRQRRFRGNPSALAELCYYRLDLQVLDAVLHSSREKPSKQILAGTLASGNCDLYMNVTAEFENQDLRSFYAKATQYAMLMTIVSMTQIYLLLRQLQSSNTQATAAKVSLLTIGQQAILDSYLCLLHLTAGIIARQIFTAFATVAFFKLIIFSIFEMRYLLLIWKARRPQSFAEGWLTMRREFTVLYSRFYCTLLFGILVVYNFWSQINFLVLAAYSFWVPQIVHNAHREVRNALDKGYLLGMSALRLILPLYIYGWPGNFPSAFPMYHYKANIAMCYALVMWMGLQVALLLLQQKFGPRFFIPARFLPQKYNYYRRIDPAELSLLHNTGDGDAIDCVICMVGVDIAARDYMLAPCDHIFHRECLEQWMQIKMECPTCRHALPEP